MTRKAKVVSDWIDTSKIEDILEEVKENQGKTLDTLGKENTKLLEKILATLGAVKNSEKLTNKEIDSRVAGIIKYFDSLGVMTKEFRKLLNDTGATLKDIKRTDKTPISSEDLSRLFTRVIGAAHTQSDYAMKHDGLTPIIGYDNPSVTNKAKINELMKELKDANKERHGYLNKIKTFFLGLSGKEKEERKKEKKSFIADFIEELEKSKLIGGGFKDVIKLLTYVGAAYLSKLGRLGKVLGVALIAAGPALAGILGRAIGKAVLGALGSLGALGAAGLAAGAAFGIDAHDSFKKGRKGEGFLLGGAAIATILGVIGMALSVPFAPIVAGVGAIVGLVTMAVKHWDRITEFLKSILTWLGIIGNDKKKESGKGPVTVRGMDGKRVNQPKETDKYGYKDKIKEAAWLRANEQEQLHFNEYGYVDNYASLTQENAYKQFKSRQKELSGKYEFVKRGSERGKHISFDDFISDLAGRDSGNHVNEVILGTKVIDDFIKKKEILKAAGFGNVDNLVITSGMATFGSFVGRAGSPHALTGTIMSHNHPFGNSYDIGVRNPSKPLTLYGRAISLNDPRIKKTWKEHGAAEGVNFEDNVGVKPHYDVKINSLTEDEAQEISNRSGKKIKLNNGVTISPAKPPDKERSNSTSDASTENNVHGNKLLKALGKTIPPSVRIPIKVGTDYAGNKKFSNVIQGMNAAILNGGTSGNW